MRNNKKGISPLIATVLLIGFTIVLAALVMRWAGSLFGDITGSNSCEPEGKITFSIQVEIDVANIEYSTSANAVTKLTVINFAMTQALEGFNVQRELDDGSVETQLVLYALGPGASANIAPGAGVVFASSTQAVKSMAVTPVFQQTVSGGGSCRIICTEQKITVPATDTRLSIIL